MPLSCPVNEILSLVSLILIRSRDPQHSFGRLSIVHALVLLCVNQHTKFELPSCTNFKYMLEDKFKKRVAFLSISDRFSKSVINLIVVLRWLMAATCTNSLDLPVIVVDRCISETLKTKTITTASRLHV